MPHSILPLPSSDSILSTVKGIRSSFVIGRTGVVGFLLSLFFILGSVFLEELIRSSSFFSGERILERTSPPRTFSLPKPKDSALFIQEPFVSENKCCWFCSLSSFYICNALPDGKMICSSFVPPECVKKSLLPQSSILNRKS